MNKQTELWSGDFGNEYTNRNIGMAESNQAFFKKALTKTTVNNPCNGLKGIIELGCGSGMNLEALSNYLPWTSLFGVEINQQASESVKEGTIFNTNVLDFELPYPVNIDLAFCKGLAIHIHPDDISKLYDQLYNLSSRYILMAEYYSPNRQMIPYRGHEDKLWKADFYGEMMFRHRDLTLIDYGFVGHWDEHPQDDLNWWLWEK